MGLASRDIYPNFHQKSTGTHSLQAAHAGATDLETRLQQRAVDMARLNGRIEDGWQGKAAGSAHSAMQPVALAMNDSAGSVQASQGQIQHQSQAFHDAKNKVQPLPAEPGVGDYIAGGLNPLGGFGVGPSMDGVIKKQAHYNAVNDANVAAVDQYHGASTSNASFPENSPQMQTHAQNVGVVAPSSDVSGPGTQAGPQPTGGGGGDYSGYGQVGPMNTYQGYEPDGGNHDSDGGRRLSPRHAYDQESVPRTGGDPSPGGPHGGTPRDGGPHGGYPDDRDPRGGFPRGGGNPEPGPYPGGPPGGTDPSRVGPDGGDLGGRGGYGGGGSYGSGGAYRGGAAEGGLGSPFAGGAGRFGSGESVRGGGSTGARGYGAGGRSGAFGEGGATGSRGGAFGEGGASGARGGASGSTGGRGSGSLAEGARSGAGAAAAAERAAMRSGAAGRPGAPGAMPMGAGRGKGDDDSEHQTPSYLITDENGSEIVGDLPKTVPPVIGE